MANSLIGRCLSNRYCILASRLILGVLFIWTSVGKITRPDVFTDAVGAYHILPAFLVPVFAVTLPWVELISGMLLILGFHARSGVLIVCLMLTAFVIAIGVNLLRGVDMDCGCFTIGGQGQSLGGAFARDILLLALGLQVLFYDRGFFGLHTLMGRRPARRR